MATRGPGETKIETDRRQIHERMAKLRREITQLKIGREVKREERRRNRVLSVALTGYTNAGKSSLLNRLTGAGVLVENALFATLDTTVRRAETPSGRSYTIADTVGFVRHLPHHLVEAFRSTIDEVADAHLVLHVVDGSNPEPEAQLASVREVLAEVVAGGLREVVVVNKADAADPDVLSRLLAAEPGSIAVSARTGEGIEALHRRSAASSRGGDRGHGALHRGRPGFAGPPGGGGAVRRAHRAGHLTEGEGGAGAASALRVYPQP